MNKLPSISGGATDIANLAGCAIGIMRSYKPDVFAGVSSGAILALPLALGKFDETETFVKRFTHKDIFGTSPFGNNGGVSFAAAKRLFLGKKSLANMDGLRNSLRKIVTKKDFDKLQYNVFVAAVNYNTGKQTVFNLKEMPYETAIEAVIASSSIPIIAEPVEIFGDLFYDGGVVDHNVANRLIETFNFSHVRTIYVRDADKNWEKTTLFSVLARTLSIAVREISVSDQKIEKEICVKKGIDYRSYNLESLMTSLFDVNHTRLIQSFVAGFAAANAPE
jgi:predicted acylesterase/phospholipase RssA